VGRLRVEVDFELEDDFWVNQECVAQSLRFDREGFEVELRLPPYRKLSAPVTMNDLRGIDGFVSGSSYAGRPTEFRAGFCNLRVCIYEVVDGISQADFEGDVTEEARNLIIEHQRKCRKIAERVAADFLDQLRYLGQTWLGSMGTVSSSVAPHTTTFDDETGYRFKYGHGEFVVQARREEATLTGGMLGRLVAALEESQGVPLAASFLADAEYFWQSGLKNETQSDLQRAVLLAAIACELKIKETLREKTSDGATALVDVLIDNPRDFSMSVAGLCDKTMKAAVGHSLREDESELYKALVEKNQKDSLFQNRNGIVHSGKLVTSKNVGQNVSAARRLFLWLENLPSLR